MSAYENDLRERAFKSGEAALQQFERYRDLLYRPCAEYLLLPWCGGEAAVADLDEYGEGEICRIFTGDVYRRSEAPNGPNRIGGMLSRVRECDESVCYDLTCGAVSHGLLKTKYSFDCDGMISMTREVCADSPLSWAFEVNAMRTAYAAPGYDPDRNDYLESLFGYLYAKAMELEYLLHVPSDAPVCRISLSDVGNGLIRSNLDAKRQRLLEEGLDYGRSLYASFLGHQTPDWFTDLKGLYYFPNLCAALMAAQSIGRLNSRRGLEWEDNGIEKEEEK